MIFEGEDQRQSFLTKFRHATDFDSLSEEAVVEFEEFLPTLALPCFPGGILAWPRKDKDTIYYALAETASQWRRLRPLLLAYVGPTVTTFNGERSPLLESSPVENLLLQSKFHTTVRIRTDPKNSEIGRRSFRRLISMTRRMPEFTRAVPLSTSKLLAKFADSLNGHDRAGAEEILETCKSELRLDALNLVFLRVKLLAHFGDWRGIGDLPEFRSICLARNPPQIGLLLLEALYHVNIKALEDQEDFEAVRQRWCEDVAPLARSLLRLPIAPGTPLGVLKLFGLQALEANPRRVDVERMLLPHLVELGQIGKALSRNGRTSHAISEHQPVELAPLETARQSLVVAQEGQTLASLSTALDAIEALDPQQRAVLLESSSFKRILEGLKVENGDGATVHGWADWVARLGEPNFLEASKFAQRLVDESTASELVDAEEILRLAQAIDSVPDVGLASERLAEALPLLTGWVASDPSFPRAGMVPVCEALVYRFVLDSRRTSLVFDSSALMIRALLSVGISGARYGCLLDDCLELAGAGAGRRSVYWLLDVLEDTIANPSPAPELRLAFWHRAYARFVPIFAHLTPGQVLVSKRLAASLGSDTELGSVLPTITVESDQTKKLAQILSNASVAIYTLTESAGRQASLAIRELAPTVKIAVSNDEVGTDSLKNLAQNTDIFVMATASAKHAATTFVQQHRPRGRPLLFAAGRGYSSIVRAIEEFALGRES